jgi:hypothetical protein
MTPLWLRRARAGAVLALVASTATGLARADGWTAIVQPGYLNSSTTTTDVNGNVTHTGSSIVLQQYRLALSDQIYPQLKLDLAGNYNWLLGNTTADAVRTDLDTKTWTGHGGLTLGSQLLSGGVAYDRLEQGSTTGTNGEVFRAPDVVRESYLAFAGWRPSDLPTLDLRFSRTNSYDKLRLGTDLTNDDALAAVRYAPAPQLDLRYSAQFTDSVDHLHASETQQIQNAASITWASRALDGRLTTAAAYNIGVRNSRVVSPGTGGAVFTQQFPIAGLSVVETLPTPERITLNPNPALIDGDTNTSAGLDLGFAGPASGDVAAREAGVQFGDPSTPVNLLYLWVDRSIPQEIAATFTFDVYRSDDNTTWTRVDLAPPSSGGPPVQFSLFQNRFEIGITQVGTSQAPARYLKVVVKPLAAGVTTDRRFANILVTELQTLLVQPTALAARSVTDTSGSLSTNAKYIIQRPWNVAYDFSGFLSHSEGLSRKTYSILNGLSFSRRVASAVNVSGRLDRTDSGGTDLSHEALNRASASLTYDPLPTLATGATFSSLLSQKAIGTGLSNSVSGFARADLYPGITVTSNAGVSYGYNEIGQTVEGTLYGVSASVTPHPTVAMTGAYNYTYSLVTGGGRPESKDSVGRVEGSLSFTPFRALYLAASASRYTSGRPPSTLATFSGGFSPFPGGDLLLRFGYTETLDQAASTRLRQYGPGARWNIRQGLFVDLTYSVEDSNSPTVTSSARAFTANLTLALH